MFVITKKLELLASILNAITASVRCVSSMIVILNAKLARLVAAHANKKDCGYRKSPTRVPCLLVETHKHLTSMAVMNMHAKSSLLYTFKRSMQANRNINLWQKKAPIYKLSRRKAPKNAANLPLQTCEKNQWTFFVVRQGRRL